jgi:hypothetical protein
MYQNTDTLMTELYNRESTTATVMTEIESIKQAVN